MACIYLRLHTQKMREGCVGVFVCDCVHVVGASAVYMKVEVRYLASEFSSILWPSISINRINGFWVVMSRNSWNRLFNNINNVIRRTDDGKLATISLVSPEKTKNCGSQGAIVQREIQESWSKEKMLRGRENGQRLSKTYYSNSLKTWTENCYFLLVQA